jgi:hypothetical protein
MTLLTSMAQVCALAAPTVVKLELDATATGTGLGVVGMPLPSWLSKFHPQQYNCPLRVTPQVCDSPALIDANVNPPLTGNGVVLLFTPSPAPSWPAALSPQQYATPSAVRAQVCDPPELNVVKEIPPATAAGLALEAGLVKYGSR